MSGSLDTNSTVFRTRQENPQETPKPENIVGKEVATDTTHEEVPYTEYKAGHGRPFLADYFGLGDYWSAWDKEISLLDDYVRRQIDSGEVANDFKVVQKMVKKMEKLQGLKEETRPAVKIGVLASYIRFLNEADGVRKDAVKYGNY
jgi:hypothetical protein